MTDRQTDRQVEVSGCLRCRKLGGILETKCACHISPLGVTLVLNSWPATVQETSRATRLSPTHCTRTTQNLDVDPHDSLAPPDGDCVFLTGQRDPSDQDHVERVLAVVLVRLHGATYWRRPLKQGPESGQLAGSHH